MTRKQGSAIVSNAIALKALGVFVSMPKKTKALDAMIAALVCAIDMAIAENRITVNRIEQ